MARSNGKNIREKTAFLYERLSRDDNLEGESYSIANQKKLLIKVAKEKGYTHLVHFTDDGISGVTMNRPGFNDMLSQLSERKGSAVFVKDLSRLGRNYIEVGRLTEDFFPENDIRLVAVSDGIDTFEGENELAPIRNLFNEWYARDISKKRRLSNKIKGNAGEPLGPPPYGYKKDPDDPKRWIVDEEAALVVRRIYSLSLSGFGTDQIAGMLIQDKVLAPAAYAASKGIRKPVKCAPTSPYQWSSASIVKILSMQEYCGDVLNFKTYSKSYKNKKRICNDPEDVKVFKDVHKPIIEREIWELIQKKRGKIRNRKTGDGEKNIFSGFLRCPDCGHNLHFHFNQKNPAIKYFSCAGYNKGSRKCCSSTHYVRVDFLEQVVLGEIRRLTRYVTKYEHEFSKAVIGYSKAAQEQDKRIKYAELKKLMTRDKDLDTLFEKIYEDNVSGKISDERFHKLSQKYEEEQEDLAIRIEKLRTEYEKTDAAIMSADMFLATVKKYTRIRKLTPKMLCELIDYIEVYQAEKVNGVHKQKLVIHYNFIGSIEIPDDLAIPDPDVKMQTRKGVVVSYDSSLPADRAV